jgi:DNA invertase Pin-like site-specific DNA recombinase
MIQTILIRPRMVTMCYVRAYLRASTDEQDATRAREQVETFATERGLQVC